MYYINPIDGDINSNLQASMRQKHLQRTGDAHSDYCFDSEKEAENAEPPTIAELQDKIEELEDQIEEPVEKEESVDDENPEKSHSVGGLELDV